MGRGPTTEVAEVDGHRIEYRLQRGPGRAMVVLPGAHMSAGTRFDRHRFAADDATFVVVSRPGYGRTPIASGPSAPEFALRVGGLCRRLGLSDVTATGVSMGSRTALSLAAVAPDVVRDVVLLCPVSFRPWPDTTTLRLARVLFSPVTEWASWGVLHLLLRSRPDVILPTAVTGLTTLTTSEMLRRMGGDLDELVAFLGSCASGRGFWVDLRPPTDVTAAVHQPSLIVATRNDGSVGFDHAERLAATLPAVELAEIDAAGHLLWLGDRAGTVRGVIRSFTES